MDTKKENAPVQLRSSSWKNEKQRKHEKTEGGEE